MDKNEGVNAKLSEPAGGKVCPGCEAAVIQDAARFSPRRGFDWHQNGTGGIWHWARVDLDMLPHLVWREVACWNSASRIKR